MRRFLRIAARLGRLGSAVVVALSLISPIHAAPPPIGTSAKILSPKFFPGWQNRNVCYPFVVNDTAAGVYRLYYSGSGTEYVNDSVWDQWMTGMATSTDTTTWKRPDNYEQTLFARRHYEGDLLDPDEEAGIFDSVFATGACVIKDGSTWKTWYTGWNGQIEHLGGGISNKINFRIGYATSPDGTKWTKISGSAGAGAVLGMGASGQPDAKGAAHPHVLKVSGTFRCWYEGYDGTTWRILYATSPDGLNWTKQGTALNPGGSGALDQLGLRNPMVINRSGLYELWYQGQSSATPNYHVLRATSIDGLAWTKISGEITLHPDVAVSGSESILVDSAIVQADNSVQVFFAKQITTNRTATYGTIQERSFYIYTEVVNP